MGGKRNKYLENCIPALYRRETMHIIIFTFIDTYRLLYPTVTIQEAAASFMVHYKIEQDFYDLNTVTSVYNRVNADLKDAERFQHKQERQKQTQTG